MKKIFIISLLVLIVPSFVFAVNFAPSPLVLSSNDVIEYAFDGSAVDIPVTVAGAPALLKFMVYTKGKADEVVDVRNGHLGWHYMNKIDTCIYMSREYQLTPGTSPITWDGKDNDGGIVPPGEYTFYLWAFDDQNARIKAVPGRPILEGWATGNQWDRCMEEFITIGEDGQPLAAPVYKHRYWRWIIGADPEDVNLFETCSWNTGEGWAFNAFGQTIPEPDNWGNVYLHLFSNDTTTCGVFKYNWVPNGEGLRDPDYEPVYFSTPNAYLTSESDGDYFYVGESNYKETFLRTYLHIIDHVNAEYIGYMDHSETFATPEDFEKWGGLYNGGYTIITITDQGLLAGGNHCCCMRAASEPKSWFDDEDDTMRWENGNGDYTIWDNNWEETSVQPWACNSLKSFRSNHSMSHDANGFIYTGQFHGAISFEVGAPDGTGVGTYSYVGELDHTKGGGMVLDAGTAYDGAYVPNTLDGELAPGRWFVGMDSFKGTIASGGVGVEDSSPTAFTVAQNSPNPFNPTTTISYSLADAGNVTIDVFNVAGQKVDTIVDGFTDAGSHSVVWDGSELSAGVYFYTVKSGEFTKTVKMTLLK